MFYGEQLTTFRRSMLSPFLRSQKTFIFINTILTALSIFGLLPVNQRVLESAWKGCKVRLG